MVDIEELVIEIPEPLSQPQPVAPPSPSAIAAQWLGLPILFPILDREKGRTPQGRWKTGYKIVAWAPGIVAKARPSFGRIDLVVVPEGGEGEVRVSAARVKGR